MATLPPSLFVSSLLLAVAVAAPSPDQVFELANAEDSAQLVTAAPAASTGSLDTNGVVVLPLRSAAAAPSASQGTSGVVGLPFRSWERALLVADTAILRFVCTRSYSAVVAGKEVPCSEAVLPAENVDFEESSDRRDGRPDATAGNPAPPQRWLFRKAAAEGAIQILELLVAPSPVRGYEVYLMGEVREKSGNVKPNPDLDAIEGNIKALLAELAAAPLDPINDRILPYQLSYVQADRAIAVLRTFGYTVVEYKKSGGDTSPTKVVFDNIFEQASAAQGGLLVRPLIIKLIDSEDTSLVDAPLPAPGTDPELAGGQPLTSIPDAAPQQRLLIVYDTSDLPSLDRLLAHLEREVDVPAKQLLIEALVIELNNDRLLDLGVDLKGHKDNFDISFEQQTGGLVQPFLFNFKQPTPRTLLEITAKLRALEERGQATVLSRPSVFVLDGRQARIKVGDNIPYTKKVVIGVGGVITSETDFLKTGIILNLRPRAAADNSDVTMQVEAIISSPGPSRVLPDIGALLAPNLQSRQIQTLVRVANDTPFVIGGLIAHNDQQSTSGIPGLSRIPYLGALFRKKNATNDRREVIVVITPHVVAADDPTYAYTISRDAGRADAEPGAGGAALVHRSFPRHAPSCKTEFKFPEFDPAMRQSKIEQGSIFDSLDAELFRNVYRLRSSDIFDLTFVTRSDDVQEFATRTRGIADKISEARFSRAPRVDRPQLEKEVLKRLLKNEVLVDKGPEVNERFVKSFLTFFEGGVPGEDILVHHMMIRLIEKLDFGSCVPPDSIIYFPEARHRTQGQTRSGLDPEYLTSGTCLRSCLKEKTLVLAFPPKPETNNEFLKTCLGPDLQWTLLEPGDDGLCDGPEPGGKRPGSDFFPPPVVRIACVPSASNDDGYLKRLRECNQVVPGGGGWQTILLDRNFERRGRNSIGLLQSVLALERLLEINDSDTFPRTLRDFHVGRELVLPTRDDLQTRRHLIDRDTARRYYETLDYYTAFARMYKTLASDFDVTMGEVEQEVLGSPVLRNATADEERPITEPVEVVPLEPPPPPN